MAERKDLDKINQQDDTKAELEHEKDILTEQARNEGKPEKIIEKMVLGRINKYYKDVCLVDHRPIVYHFTKSTG